ncbi:MAG TPA: hypothetical protein VFE61_05900, partial [Candidatus Sulfotelmatobacter sp.]|nr:hypothetical protein [Candidatus Sulfotelmatobacter sp.]
VSTVRRAVRDSASFHLGAGSKDAGFTFCHGPCLDVPFAETDAPPGPIEAAVLLDADPPPPTLTVEAAVFDVVAPADVSRTATVLASDFSHVATFG